MQATILFFVFYGWLLVNIVTFLVYGFDKLMAIYGKWRVSEATLFVLAIIGGSVGALMGMELFRHKTQKRSFRIIVPLVALLHAAAAFWLIFLWFSEI